MSNSSTFGTARQYEFLARYFAQALSDAAASGEVQATKSVISLALEMSRLLKEDNPNFDQELFSRNCGL